MRYLPNSRYFSKLKLQIVPPYLSETSKKRHFFALSAREAPTMLSVRPVPRITKSKFSSLRSNLFSFFFFFLVDDVVCSSCFSDRFGCYSCMFSTSVFVPEIFCSMSSINILVIK